MIDGYSSFEPIGHGGFSTVYLAYEPDLDRHVAIKVLHADLRDGDTQRRFDRERRATGRLTGHPHIITVYRTGATWDNRPFLAMERIEGGSLRDRIKAEGPLPVATAVGLMLPVADALATAHRAGVLHRDLKPANILLRGPHDPVLSDFGIASVFDGTDQATTTAACTPRYAAPEVLSGETHGPASDMFSFGATLYNLLTATTPFAGEVPVQLLLRILADDRLPIGRPDVPPDLDALIQDLLAADPDRRPGWAEITDRLTALAPGRAAGPARPSPTPPSSTRPSPMPPSPARPSSTPLSPTLLSPASPASAPPSSTPRPPSSPEPARARPRRARLLLALSLTALLARAAAARALFPRGGGAAEPPAGLVYT
ncbi:serine/threonine-protein kinase, partial [Frankia nepalensis]|uniref:serine/threonine-protein kinase n=1 Tax=Frankia nepalensis TaxID=1836974 RepID=UPI001932E123